MTDNRLIEILKDEFGLYDTMVFCELYSRYCEIADWNIEEKEFDIWFYRNKSEELKKLIKDGKVNKVQ